LVLTQAQQLDLGSLYESPPLIAQPSAAEDPAVS
jgi:hypothetical protein